MRESIDPHTFFVHGLEFEPNSPALHSYIGRPRAISSSIVSGLRSIHTDGMCQELFRKKNVFLPIPLCHIVSKDLNDEFRPQW